MLARMSFIVSNFAPVPTSGQPASYLRFRPLIRRSALLHPFYGDMPLFCFKFNPPKNAFGQFMLTRIQTYTFISKKGGISTNFLFSHQLAMTNRDLQHSTLRLTCQPILNLLLLKVFVPDTCPSHIREQEHGCLCDYSDFTAPVLVAKPLLPRSCIAVAYLCRCASCFNFPFRSLESPCRPRCSRHKQR